MVDISNFTAAKILAERPSPPGVGNRFELKPMWLIADLVEKAKMDAFTSGITRMVSHREAVWGR
jgi:hypothetical protein